MSSHLPRRHARRLTRVLVGTTTVGAGLLLLAGPASAHVEIQEGDQAADSYAVLTFGVPHGCDDSPTTKIRIQLPESIPTATPTLNSNWDISLVQEKVDPPIEQGEGESLTERITEVDFTAKTPLPIGFRDDLSISVHIPKDAAGTTLVFPTIQECVVGSTEWTQVPAEGQDAEELAHPAPSVNVVEASEEGDHHSDDATDTTEAAASDDSGDSDDGGSSNGLAIAGLITGIAGMLLGGGAFVAAKKTASDAASDK